MIYRCIIWIFLFTRCFHALGSHLIGGDLGYTYMGPTATGKFKYRIRLTTYTDCSPTSQIPYPETPLKIGIYGHNSSIPTLNKPRIDSASLSLVSSLVISPNLPPGCVIGQNTCIVKGIYETTIDLNPTTDGYHIFYERCCRNIGIINLQPNQSSSFHVFIPPTAIVNSSPVFVDDPIPFICAGENTPILNLAIDPDGDSLTYQFDTPLNGFGDVFNTLPQLPSPELTWPIPSVVYVPGFSSSIPFGGSGVATILSNNGISNYLIPLPGAFVICVRINEYRNGILIGSVRRELQLLSILCPVNPKPELSNNTIQSLIFEPGDSICIPVTFIDPNNNDILLSSGGNIFFQTPQPYFLSPPTANDTVTGYFCWNLPCQADTGQFLLWIKAEDNGCPPKMNLAEIMVNVRPLYSPVITGPDTVCETVSSVVYTCQNILDGVHHWQVINGTIHQQSGDSVWINWSTGNNGRLIVHSFNRNGCPAGSDTLNVTFIQVPSIVAMEGDTVCTDALTQLTATGTSSVWYWLPPYAVSNPSISDPYAITDTSRWYFVAGLPDGRCPASDSVYIGVWPKPHIVVSNDTIVCKYDTLMLHVSGGNQYVWEPQTLFTNPEASVQNIGIYQDNLITVFITDTNQCTYSESIAINVYPSIIPNLQTSYTLCLGDTVQLIANAGMYYLWYPPLELSSDTISSPLCFATSNRNYILTITDSNSCSIDTTVQVYVYPKPEASYSLLTPLATCSGMQYQTINNSQSGQSYTWFVNGITYSSSENPLLILPFGQDSYVNLQVLNNWGCADSFLQQITVQDLIQLLGITLPNVMTPNDDGLNDALNFGIPDGMLSCTHVYVYNRWGKLVYQGTHGQSIFSGLSSEGKKLQTGVYFYTVQIADLTYSGHVTILE